MILAKEIDLGFSSRRISVTSVQGLSHKAALIADTMSGEETRIIV